MRIITLFSLEFWSDWYLGEGRTFDGFRPVLKYTSCKTNFRINIKTGLDVDLVPFHYR